VKTFPPPTGISLVDPSTLLLPEEPDGPEEPDDPDDPDEPLAAEPEPEPEEQAATRAMPARPAPAIAARRVVSPSRVGWSVTRYLRIPAPGLSRLPEPMLALPAAPRAGARPS
jgi:hypothetical protein